MARFETPESILPHKESPEGLNKTEEALYKLLVPANKARAIQIEEFSDLYALDAIKKDASYTEERKKHFKETDSTEKRIGKMRGDLFEAIVNSQIAESDWMGPDADVIVPSEYDDFKNGVDSILEFEREEGGAHLALAIDVTESKKKMLEKFGDIKASIRTGSLSRVKYFRSRSFRGELSGIPRVVVGAGFEAVDDIAKLILRFKRLQSTIAESRKNSDQIASSKNAGVEFAKVRTEIAEHPLQGILLNEIKVQLESFRDYAHRIGKEDIVDQYSKVLALIDSVIEGKGDLAKFDESLAQDPIYKLILESKDF